MGVHYTTLRGVKLYCAVLRTLAATKRPMTAAQIAQAIDSCPRSVSDFLGDMQYMGEGVVRMAGYVTGGHGRTPKQWTLDPAPSAPLNAADQKRAKYRVRRPGVEVLSFRYLINAVIEGPTTVAELCLITGLDQHTVLRIVNSLHRRVLRIGDWLERDFSGGTRAAMWQWGPGKADATKPKPLTKVEIQQRYWRRHSAAKKAALITTALAANGGAFQQRA